MQSTASARLGNKLCVPAPGLLCSSRYALQKVCKLWVNKKPGYLFSMLFFSSCRAKWLLFAKYFISDLMH